MAQEKKPKKYEIFIDKVKFEVTKNQLTGSELRALPSPPIGDDRNLYLEVPGDEDRLIETTDIVKIKSGEHFITVPKTINPGA